MKREIVVLHGRVQAVGYRERVLEVARGRSIAGTVRNLRAGTLELDVEGDDAAIDDFVQAVVEERPSFARVDYVERHTAEPRGVSGFERIASG